MKTKKTTTLILKIGVVSLVFISNIAIPGFEIGNGKKLIKNLPGTYEIVVPKRLEVGFSSRFTEVIAPLSDGTPRAKLQINIVKNEKIGSLNELINSVSADNSWKPTTIAGFDGMRNEITLPTRLHQIEYRLFLKEFEVLVVTIEGIPDYSPKSTFETLQKALETLKIKAK